MPFENPLLAKLFEGVLEGRSVDFENEMLPRDEVLKAIDLLPIPLSRRQREAVFRAWTNEVSYIQGPPGTGKSHTITAIMLAALFLKKRVLLVSHKKPAIDVVFEKLTKDSPGRPAMLGAGSVIYASNESAQRQRMRGELQLWLARCGTLHGHSELEEFRRKRAHHRGHVEQLRAEVEQLETQIKKALEWERDFYHRQERLNRNRKSYRDRFGATDLTSPKLSSAADSVRALAVLKDVEQLLGDGVHASGDRAGNPRRAHREEAGITNTTKHMAIEKTTIKAICWRADAPDKRLQGELQYGPTSGADADLFGHIYDGLGDKRLLERFTLHGLNFKNKPSAYLTVWFAAAK